MMPGPASATGEHLLNGHDAEMVGASHQQTAGRLIRHKEQVRTAALDDVMTRHAPTVHDGR
jgi:hypothetical protein